MEKKMNLAIALGVGVTGALLAKYHPDIIDTLNDVRDKVDETIGIDLRLLMEKLGLAAAGMGATYLWTQGKIKKLRKENAANLFALKHDKMFAVTTLDIEADGRLYVKNQANYDTYHRLFPAGGELADIIEAGIGRMDYENNSVIVPFTDTEGQTIYPKIRDHAEIFNKDRLQGIGEREHGIERRTTEFISVLSKSPRYKNYEDEGICMVDEKDEEADSSSKIRLLTIRRSLIDKTLAWAERNGEQALDFICNDHNLNCPKLDAYIRHMLDDNRYLEDDRTPVNTLFRTPTHRTYMMAIAQMAKHIKEGGGFVSIKKPVGEDISSLIKDTASSRIKKKLAAQKKPKKIH